MPRKTSPKYRYHKARDCAVVTINGRDHYLGAYDSDESRQKYHRLVAEHLAAPHQPATPPNADAPLTMTELMAAYWRFVKGFYVKGGEPTSEVHAIKLALKFVRRLYPDLPACEFSPKKLMAVREAMIRHDIVRTFKKRDPATGEVVPVKKLLHRGMSRKCINKLVARIKRMFRWAVEEELVPVTVHDALCRVSGLKRGKSAARETARVRPVSEEHVRAVMAVVPKRVAALIEFQWLCGCRPQDAVQLRAFDIDRSGAVWEYRPPRYKTEHHNDDALPDLERVVFIGPKAQGVIAPYLPDDPADYVFSPRRSEAARNADRKEKRASPMTPSQAARKPKGRKKAPLKPHYSVASYRRAVQRGCVKAGMPVWSPNQLRHSRLTAVRAKFGLEASRVVGGHREVATTQIYAEEDRTLARRVMAEMG